MKKLNLDFYKLINYDLKALILFDSSDLLVSQYFIRPNRTYRNSTVR